MHEGDSCDESFCLPQQEFAHAHAFAGGSAEEVQSPRQAVGIEVENTVDGIFPAEISRDFPNFVFYPLCKRRREVAS